MKKLIIMLLMVANIASAQQLRVKSVQQLTSTNDGIFSLSEFLPKTNLLLISNQGFEGLYLLDFKRKKIKNITTDKGAGYKPAVSPDGKTIVYRSDEYQGALKYQSLTEFDIKSQKKKKLVDKTRSLSTADFIDNELIYSVESDKKSHIYPNMKMEQKRSENAPYIRLENLKPVIYQNNQPRQLMPNGEGNYIWVSISPDATKMVYNFNGLGTYISDLNGNIVAELGKFHAPRWVNNDILVGMNDVDDGSKMISSDIVSYSIENKQTTQLTHTSDCIETYPIPNLEKGVIAYYSEKGEIYLLHFEIAE